MYAQYHVFKLGYYAFNDKQRTSVNEQRSPNNDQHNVIVTLEVVRRAVAYICNKEFPTLNARRVLPLCLDEDRSNMFTRGNNVRGTMLRDRNGGTLRINDHLFVRTNKGIFMRGLINARMVTFINVGTKRNTRRGNGKTIALAFRSTTRRAIIRRIYIRKRVIGSPFFSSKRNLVVEN